MTDYLLLDIFRAVLSVALLLLAAMVARLAWLRRGSLDRMGVHWAAYLSYATSLVLLALLRIGHAGEPASWDLWAAVVVAALGWYAVMKRAKFTHKPPWAR